MCFGSRSRSPRIIYQGPSEEYLRAYRESLAQYQQQSMEQQRLYSRSIEQQIEAANTQAEAFQNRLMLERERTAALNAAHQGAYRSSSKEVVPPPEAETTQLVAPVVKGSKKPSLRVGRQLVKKKRGTGLNIGV